MLPNKFFRCIFFKKDATVLIAGAQSQIIKKKLTLGENAYFRIINSKITFLLPYTHELKPPFL